MGWRLRTFLAVAACTGAVAASLGRAASAVVVLIPWAGLVLAVLWALGPRALSPNQPSTAELARRRLQRR
ncbi:MAG: hypothetical protein ACXVYM_07365 [Gaiellaceae bacterium]